MTPCNSVKVKVSGSEWNKLKWATKNETVVILRISF